MKKQILAILIIVSTIGVSCGGAKVKKLKSGIEFTLLQKGSGKRKMAEGDVITMHMKSMVNDSVLYDSYKMNGGQPVPGNITKPAFSGDIMEGLLLMSEGDSALITVPADSLFRQGKPEIIKNGDTMKFIIKIVSAKSEAEYKKEMEEAAKKQNAIDDKLIADYVASKQLTAQKTASGIYYVIEKTGNGKHPSSADLVKVHYSGTLLDGTKFDSSYDRGEPAEFNLDQVIKGWTEGIPVLDEGGKGTLIIPSSLAYGQNPPPGSPIKPNSVLVFEVELLKVTPSK